MRFPCAKPIDQFLELWGESIYARLERTSPSCPPSNEVLASTASTQCGETNTQKSEVVSDSDKTDCQSGEGKHQWIEPRLIDWEKGSKHSNGTEGNDSKDEQRHEQTSNFPAHDKGENDVKRSKKKSRHCAIEIRHCAL